MTRTVTVRFNEDDNDYKQLIKDLKSSNSPNNPYYRRSESEIVKLLLKDILEREHKKHCGFTQ